MELLLDGKKAIVTGAASGIGRATAVRLASEGVDVVGLDIDEAGLESLVTESTSYSGIVRSAVVDFMDATETIEAVRRSIQALGGLDLLINNVGSGAVRTFEQLTEQ